MISSESSENREQYRIKIFGHISGKRIELPEHAALKLLEDGSTEILCSRCDQSELYAVLNRIMDLGLKLIEVKMMKRGDINESH